MSSFINEIKAKAAADKKTIVLPESNDKRTYEAIELIKKEGFADLVLIASADDIAKYGAGYDLSGVTVVDPFTNEKTTAYAEYFAELRKSKGMTYDQALAILQKDYTYYGVMMVKAGDADGMVSGACHTTADTLRPCLQILKTAPGVKTVSSFFLMIIPNCEYGENGTLVFSDCGLVQDPTSEEMSTIAGSSAASFKKMVGAEPKVAFLSHSSMGSAKHALVDKVTAAVALAKEEYPQYQMDGELQLDAAIVPKVGASKAPNSQVAGHANVLIFPNLDAGNIGYKLVQRFAKAEAYGPICQGLAKPVNDLSRGCSAEDIVGVVAITAVQAQG